MKLEEEFSLHQKKKKVLMSKEKRKRCWYVYMYCTSYWTYQKFL